MRCKYKNSSGIYCQPPSFEKGIKLTLLYLPLENTIILKKVLIITYHWPPSGGVTVLRCLKFAKYLRDFGWEPVIFTAKNGAYQYLDYSNEKEIPSNLEIHKVSAFEPTKIFKIISGRKKSQPLQNITTTSSKKNGLIDSIGMWIRGNFFIPDARSKWIKPSEKYLSNYLKSNRIDAILTDGPPHTNTVIGLKISKKFSIPWLADFQDPWTQVDYYSKLYIGKRADKKHRFLEQETFKTAKKITIASDSWKTDLESIGAKNVDVIYYGYDESEFLNYSPKNSNIIQFFHGGLLGDDRNPISFFKALQSIIKQHPEVKSTIKIRFAGEVDFYVKKTISDLHLDENVEYLGMISRPEILREYENASHLILPINKAVNAKGRIPGKTFEMLRSNKPVIVFGPNEGDVKKIVEIKKRGVSFEYSDEVGIYNFLNEIIVKQKPFEIDVNSNITEFSNRELTKKIAFYLDSIKSGK